MAFAVMDFLFHGRRDLAQSFAEAYFRAANDDEGRVLLPLFTAYRAAVRGAVEGMKLAEAEVSADEHAAARDSARGHWLLALGVLEEPARRPALVLVGGLPGSGKSTLAKTLAHAAGLEPIRSDEVRKALAGISEEQRLAEEFYSPEWNERTYAECLHRAETRLFEGGRVLVDATFRKEKQRRLFFEAAPRRGVPALGLECRARRRRCGGDWPSGAAMCRMPAGPNTCRPPPSGRCRNQPRNDFGESSPPRERRTNRHNGRCNCFRKWTSPSVIPPGQARRLGAATVVGKVTTNSLPRPGPSLNAVTSPPCRCTSDRTRFRPMPSPPREPFSACVNKSKMCGSTAGANPMPVSRTRSTAWPAWRCTVSQMQPPGSV